MSSRAYSGKSGAIYFGHSLSLTDLEAKISLEKKKSCSCKHKIKMRVVLLKLDYLSLENSFNITQFMKNSSVKLKAQKRTKR
jgi:hypothetical protein